MNWKDAPAVMQREKAIGNIAFALRNRKIDLEGWFRAQCIRGMLRTFWEMVTLR